MTGIYLKIVETEERLPGEANTGSLPKAAQIKLYYWDKESVWM